MFEFFGAEPPLGVEVRHSAVTPLDIVRMRASAEQ